MSYFKAKIINAPNQGSFTKKELWERQVRAPKAPGSRRRTGWDVGRGCPFSHQGRGLWRGLCPLPIKKFRFWILNRRILLQTECFLYNSPKDGLNAVPTVKITSGTRFPGVPAGNDPCTKFDFSWGSAPDPAGGVYNAPPDSTAGLRGPTSKGKEGTEGKGKEGRRGRGKGMEERKGERCPGFAFEIYGHLS